MANQDREKAKRLAAALRENLRRRKAQAREQDRGRNSESPRRKPRPMNTEMEE